MKFSTCRRLLIAFLMTNSLTMIAKAQVQIGVKGGLNIAEMLTSGNPTTVINGTDQHLKYFPFTSFHGGAFVYIPFAKKWGLQPELVFSAQGATGKPVQNYLVSITEEDYRFSYLNIPILVKYKLPVGFFAETGPQVGLLVHAKVGETMVGSTGTVNYSVKNMLKSTDFSWTLGAGYCSPFNVGFDIRYNLGLSDINGSSEKDQASAPIPNGTMKNSVFQIGVFYIFGKPRFNPPAPSE
ncbi:MAG: porin family protein [Bacteroidota bacterium]